jgi:hypothetical protein
MGMLASRTREQDPATQTTRRVWAQDVAVNADVLRGRLTMVRARLGPDVPPDKEATLVSVERLLDRAEKAAFRRDPSPTRIGNAWRGTLVEAAYQNLHAAEAEIVTLYDDADVAAEVPEAVARVEQALHRDDPRRRAVHALPRMPAGDARRAALRKAIEVGTGASDRQHTRVRSFRNVVLVTALLLLLLVIAFAAVAAASPRSLPLCFQPDPGTVCPGGGDEPQPQDAAVVALIGALGGALAAAVSIRNLRGTSTPYDMPVALCLLKVPAGALTAIGALVAIRGNFVPGLSNLDSQEQILAYALVFGYAQQLLTRLIDDRASSVLDGVPSKDANVHRPVLEDPDPVVPLPLPVAHEPETPAVSGGGVPLPRAAAEATAPQQAEDESEVDVVDLLDTQPVPLVPGALGEAYDVLRDQHFAFGDPDADSEQDRFDGVEYVDDDVAHPADVGAMHEPYPAGADGAVTEPTAVTSTRSGGQ